MSETVGWRENTRWQRIDLSKEDEVIWRECPVIIWIVACGCKRARVENSLEFDNDGVERFVGKALFSEYMP